MTVYSLSCDGRNIRMTPKFQKLEFFFANRHQSMGWTNWVFEHYASNAQGGIRSDRKNIKFDYITDVSSGCTTSSFGFSQNLPPRESNRFWQSRISTNFHVLSWCFWQYSWYNLLIYGVMMGRTDFFNENESLLARSLILRIRIKLYHNQRLYEDFGCD